MNKQDKKYLRDFIAKWLADNNKVLVSNENIVFRILDNDVNKKSKFLDSSSYNNEKAFKYLINYFRPANSIKNVDLMVGLISDLYKENPALAVRFAFMKSPKSPSMTAIDYNTKIIDIFKNDNETLLAYVSNPDFIYYNTLMFGRVLDCLDIDNQYKFIKNISVMRINFRTFDVQSLIYSHILPHLKEADENKLKSLFNLLSFNDVNDYMSVPRVSTSMDMSFDIELLTQVRNSSSETKYKSGEILNFIDYFLKGIDSEWLNCTIGADKLFTNNKKTKLNNSELEVVVLGQSLNTATVPLFFRNLIDILIRTPKTYLEKNESVDIITNAWSKTVKNELENEIVNNTSKTLKTPPRNKI